MMEVPILGQGNRNPAQECFEQLRREGLSHKVAAFLTDLNVNLASVQARLKNVEEFLSGQGVVPAKTGEGAEQPDGVATGAAGGDGGEDGATGTVDPPAGERGTAEPE